MRDPINPFISKEEIEVRITFWGEEGELEATVFVASVERIYDLMNNGVPFLALRVGGQIQIVNKARIGGVVPLDDERMERRARHRKLPPILD